MKCRAQTEAFSDELNVASQLNSSMHINGSANAENDEDDTESDDVDNRYNNYGNGDEVGDDVTSKCRC